MVGSENAKKLPFFKDFFFHYSIAQFLAAGSRYLQKICFENKKSEQTKPTLSEKYLLAEFLMIRSFA